MAFPITLFDLPAKDGVAWSLNPWKTRMLLNFKGLPYTTEWVEYPDVEPRLKAIGLAPNEQSTPYTIPAIRLNASDGTLIYAMDSSRIASLIEKHYPSPPLYVSSAIHHRVQKLTEDAFPPLYGVFLPGVTRDLLNPRSKEYMDRTRGALLGMPLEQYEKEKGGEQAWANAEQPLKEIEQLLQAEDGPFFMGKTGASSCGRLIEVF